MKEFEYLAPKSLEEALEALERYGEGAVVMAGGTDVLVSLNRRTIGPDYVVNIGDLKELQGLRFDVWASILQDKRCLGTSQGNVIINKGGLNGPGVMNLSHLVHLYAGEALTLRLDFYAPHADALTSAAPPAGGVKSLRALLLRVLPPKAADLLLGSAHTMPDLDVRSLGQSAQDLLDLGYDKAMIDRVL